MKLRLLPEILSVGISEAYQLNSVYRPVKWDAQYVLTDRRKREIRNRYLMLTAWLGVALMLLFTALTVSNLDTRESLIRSSVSKTAIFSADEAYNRGHYAKAQETYRQAIQSGQISPVLWQNYDRSLLMRVFHQAEQDGGILAPDNSQRLELVPEYKPVNTIPVEERMTEEEILEDRQRTMEWLGC